MAASAKKRGRTRQSPKVSHSAIRTKASPRPSAPRFASCMTKTRSISERVCTTAQPASIARRLSARDESPDADHLTVYLDPRHDHRTGAEFTISAAGVQRDAVISNDTSENNSWDAVWTSAVTIDGDGWSAEIRIPLSQLRFNAGGVQTWGINVSRYLRRANETSWLELVPKNENGLASRMIHLTGHRRYQAAAANRARTVHGGAAGIRSAVGCRRSLQRRRAHFWIRRARCESADAGRTHSRRHHQSRFRSG